MYLFPPLVSARRDAQKAAKESAKRFQVNSTIATKTAEEFKQLNERNKAAKKESIETAKLNKGAGVIVNVHDTAPKVKQMQEERKMKKKEAVGKCYFLPLWVIFCWCEGGTTENLRGNAAKKSTRENVCSSCCDEIFFYGYNDAGMVFHHFVTTATSSLGNSSGMHHKWRNTMQ